MYKVTTLETRRLREDQIEVAKILNGYENIDRNIFVTHLLTSVKDQCRLEKILILKEKVEQICFVTHLLTSVKDQCRLEKILILKEKVEQIIDRLCKW